MVTTPKSPISTPASPSKESAASKPSSWEICYVQSASATMSSSVSTSKYRRVYNPSGTYYEVNLEAWNCTCPAFNYSAFGRVFDYNADEVNDAEDGAAAEADLEHEPADWQFGGTLTKEGTGAPICKHILAAVLGKALPGLFKDGVGRKEVTAVEAAGWGGGWGD